MRTTTTTQVQSSTKIRRKKRAKRTTSKNMSKSKPTKVKKRRRSSGTAPTAPQDHQDVVNQLQSMGYNPRQIQTALRAGATDISDALDFIQNLLADDGPPPRKRRRMSSKPVQHDDDSGSDLEILGTGRDLDDSVMIIGERKSPIEEDDADVKMVEVDREPILTPLDRKFAEKKKTFQNFIDEREELIFDLDKQLKQTIAKRDESRRIYDANGSRSRDIHSEDITKEELCQIIEWYRSNTALDLEALEEQCDDLQKRQTQVETEISQRQMLFQQEEEEYESLKLAQELMEEEERGGGKIDLYSRNVQYFLKKGKEIPEECDCPICFCPAPLKESLVLRCTHAFCLECMGHMMRIKIEERQVTNLVCPQDECEEPITHEDVRLIITDDKMFRRFDEYLTEKTLQQASDCKFCPAPDCGTPMFGDKTSPMMRCPKCSKQFCFNCLTEEWHEGVSCEAFQQWKKENGEADAKFSEWANSNTKECPRCNSRIEKNGGCNHMTCRSCKHEFHWETLEDWKGYNHQYRGNAPIYPGVPNQRRFDMNNFHNFLPHMGERLFNFHHGQFPGIQPNRLVVRHVDPFNMGAAMRRRRFDAQWQL